MKAAMYKSLFLAMLFSVGAVNASTEVTSKTLSFELEASCVQSGNSDSIALQECDMTVSSFEQQGQTPSDEAYVESAEAVESVASPVPEPSTAALMVLGFGVLSMAAGARLKRM